MNQKIEKPSISGQRIKTRKRDEKEKYEPKNFRDALISGLKEAGNDLELISKYLDSTANKLDFRRYAEILFDILFTGGILAPGGSMADENAEKTPFYVFITTTDAEIMGYFEVFNNLMKRYKYLEKSFEDEILKLIKFLKNFTEESRQSFAHLIGICLAKGFIRQSCIVPLFEGDDHMVKNELALSFVTTIFTIWLRENNVNNVSSGLHRAGLDEKLLNIFPSNKRSTENFCKYFKSVGLNGIAEIQLLKASKSLKKEIGERLAVLIDEETEVTEIINWLKNETPNSGLNDLELTSMVWNKVMSAVEWNKKEELVTEQALKHIKIWIPLFSLVCNGPKTELTLLKRCQEYCFDNMHFMKSFSRITIQLYKAEVIGEDAILKWYNEAHLPKGKTVFLGQMQKFVEWLKNAEEEESEEEKN